MKYLVRPVLVLATMIIGPQCVAVAEDLTTIPDNKYTDLKGKHVPSYFFQRVVSIDVSSTYLIDSNCTFYSTITFSMPTTMGGRPMLSATSCQLTYNYSDKSFKESNGNNTHPTVHILKSIRSVIGTIAPKENSVPWFLTSAAARGGYCGGEILYHGDLKLTDGIDLLKINSMQQAAWTAEVNSRTVTYSDAALCYGPISDKPFAIEVKSAEMARLADAILDVSGRNWEGKKPTETVAAGAKP